MIDQATDYAEAVVSGEIVAGPHVRAACRRHLNDLETATVRPTVLRPGEPWPGRGLVWDVEASERVIGFFRDVLTVEAEVKDEVDGGVLSVAVPFVLVPWQCFVVGSLFGWKRSSGLRRFRRAYIEAGKGPLALDTPIATPAGWSTMGALQVGDEVFTPAGTPTAVVDVSPIFVGRDCYRLTFDDGETIVADAEHRWFTEQRKSGSTEKGAAMRGVRLSERGAWRRGIRTTAEIAETLRYRNGAYMSANHSIALGRPLELPELDLPIEPYALGVWLGDGDSDCARITVGEQDDLQLLDNLRAVGVAVGERRGNATAGRYRIGGRTTTTCYRGHPRSETVKGHCRACERERDRAERGGRAPEAPSVFSIQQRLRQERLFGDKRIPKAYMRASADQRLALLQGLMDTDGHIAPHGGCEISLSSERLAADVWELATSLGLKVTGTTNRATLYGKDCGPRHRVRFFAPDELQVFRLDRKAERQRLRHTRRRLSGERRIVACERVPSVPVRCITVADEGHMFLAGRALVPTCNSGKSPLAAGIGHYMLAATGKLKAEVYSAATDKDQAAILFRDAVSMWQRSPHLKRRLVSSGVNPVWQLTDMKRASFFKPISSDKKGKSGIRPYCALIDEIHEHPDNSVIEMLRAGTKGNQDALIIEITNALAIDTPIPTPAGWSTMGALQPGDAVFDETGAQCVVTGVSAAMSGHECYRVEFDHGHSIIADAGHLWRTKQLRSCVTRDEWRQVGKWAKRERIGVRTTKEIAATVISHGFWNHSIEVTGALDVHAADLPVDPYVLGVWLGDGYSREAAIVVSEQDEQILEEIADRGVSVSGRYQSTGCSVYRLGVSHSGRRGDNATDSLQFGLRQLGVLNDKHIPTTYMRASAAQRLALLQGLMDTDGHIAPRTGRCVFTQHRESIAAQVEELVNSLGIKTTIRRSEARLRGKTFPRWDVFFYPPWDMEVFKLRRKQAHNRPRHNRKRMSGNRRIVAVTPVQSVPVKCIAVDSPSRLFAAGRSMVPTHNSGWDRKSVCYLEHEHSVRVAHGQIENDQWFSYVCGMDEGDLPLQDESCWIKANPTLGVTIQPDFIREQVVEALGMPSKEAWVQRLHFCVWTEAETAAFPRAKLERCFEPFDPAELVDFPCYGGLDLSRANDLTALTLLWLIDATIDAWRFKARTWFWTPRDTMHERAKRDRTPYDRWAKAGYIEAVAGQRIGYSWVAHALGEICGRYGPKVIGADQYGLENLRDHMTEIGLDLPIAVHPQGFRPRKVGENEGFKDAGADDVTLWMPASIDRLEASIVEGRLQLDDNPCMKACMSGVVFEKNRTEHRMFAKDKATSRIDGAVSLAMAIGVATVGRKTTKVVDIETMIV